MTRMPARKLFIETYGCQMNVYDSQRVGEILEGEGFALTDHVEDADMVILNTCHIREKAAEKVYSEIGRLRLLRQPGGGGRPDLKIAVAGCVAQAEGEEIVRRTGAVDLVLGPQAYHQLPDLVARLDRGERHVIATQLAASEKFDSLQNLPQPMSPPRRVAAFLTVQEGCDKFCTFCVVPYTRGAEHSRPVGQIVAEAERLAASGVREITLLGQNVNAYRGEGADGRPSSLAQLIDKLSAIAGIARLRYTTSHPCDMDEDLIAAHGRNPRLMPFLHLPVQCGSDRMLASMNRRHDVAFYLDLVDKIRAACPDIALSSDFIVGFPGEDEADFEATMELVRTVGFAQAYSFKYSPRPGTPAADRANQVPEEVKNARLRRLQDLLTGQRTSFNEKMLGAAITVLLERKGRHSGQLIGRSPHLQAVHLKAGLARIGDIVTARVDSVGPNSLSAHIVSVAEEIQPGPIEAAGTTARQVPD